MRVFLHTFGCKANQYDTDVIRQAIEAAGARIVRDPAKADAAVLNSCTVTRSAEAAMRGMVRRIARQGGSRTVVMGCAAALDDGAIAALPGVAGVVGGADPASVLRALDLPAAPIHPVLRSSARRGRAWLKIQDGCDEHCTFCATTLARGASRSRPVAEIVEEAQLLARDHAELVLTGVHIGSFGRDLGGASLGTLVERLVEDVPAVRFRLSSLEATEVEPAIADLMAGAPDRLAPHLHAPLQSGSDRLLKRMGRHWYSARSYRERVEDLATRIPVLGLGADVITGFPGETEHDHRATVALIETLPFTYLHVFPYSERPGAPARRMDHRVPPPVAAERSAELRELARVKAGAHLARRDGTLADIVLEGHRRGIFTGLTEDYLEVRVVAETAAPARFRAPVSVSGDAVLHASAPAAEDSRVPDPGLRTP